MATSQNGLPILAGTSGRLYTWTIPAKNGVFRIKLRNGSIGFLLAYLLLWYSEVMEDLSGKILDDWGWAPSRPVRGGSTPSNHGSGSAVDVNALLHPLGRIRTGIFRYRRKRDALNARLRFMRNTIRWGGNYHGRVDEMHFEVICNITVAEREARRLMKTWRGQRLLKANPSQKKVILS